MNNAVIAVSLYSEEKSAKTILTAYLQRALHKSKYCESRVVLSNSKIDFTKSSVKLYTADFSAAKRALNVGETGICLKYLTESSNGFCKFGNLKIFLKRKNKTQRT